MIDKTKEALENILNNKEIKTVFQPIISLKDGNILGHEALSRITSDSIIKNPEMLFTIAEKHKYLWDLELLCRTTAFEAAFKFMIPPYSKKLFINVNPNTMQDETFHEGFTKNFLSKYRITPNNIIFEITERNAIDDMNSFRSVINHYKNQSYKIAIDDVGSGYSGLNLISDVNPNYIKLDMKLIRDIDKDSLKYALVKGMVELSKVSNIFLIAEGIETYEELDTLIDLGVQYGQGYFIQKPNENIEEINSKVIMSIKKSNIKKNQNSQKIISNIHISNLCKSSVIVSPTDMIPDIYEIFKNNPNCFGICVIEDEIPIGIVTQEKLALKLSGYYGFVLNQNKDVSHLMDRDFLTVDYKTPINIVSSIAMSRPNDKLYDFIVVTENNKYLGTVTIKDLLLKTTEMEISMAKHQNPLSGLPGNLIIEQRLNHCITSESKYSVAYLDIDNFKAYNDIYGFENGDLVITLLADILKHHIPNEQFIGHIGGDDFVVILNEFLTEDYFTKIVNKFEFDVLDLYNKADIENGFISTTNRHGIIEIFPLITLTTVVVNNQKKTYNNIFELTKELAYLKKVAKQNKTNKIYNCH